ncbi:DNA-binding protein [Pelagibacterium lacus]|uniref:DNA-binding protein n=1 Tax=Pelagibacterium lacus TaxID=2282655 RepID=A0A369W129_9HYPH|nr:DNA-binding protein [Pelagibacterium lacus]
MPPSKTSPTLRPPHSISRSRRACVSATCRLGPNAHKPSPFSRRTLTASSANCTMRKRSASKPESQSTRFGASARRAPLATCGQPSRPSTSTRARSLARRNRTKSPRRKPSSTRCGRNWAMSSSTGSRQSRKSVGPKHSRGGRPDMTQPDTDHQPPFTPETLSRRWDCSPQHIRDLVAAGQLPAFRVGRLIRIPATAVRDFECPNSEPSSTGAPGTPYGTIQVAPPRGVPFVPKIVRKPNDA